LGVNDGTADKIAKASSWSKVMFFSDNFYTRPSLATTLANFADGKAGMIGTIKFINVDGTNRYYLAKAMEIMKDVEKSLMDACTNIT
jgi:hypothetical protein